MELNLSFIIMSIDRFIGIFPVENSPSRADMIKDQLAQFVWAILDNGAPIALPTGTAR